MQENGRKNDIAAIQLPQNERTTATYAGRARTPHVPTLRTKKRDPKVSDFMVPRG